MKSFRTFDCRMVAGAAFAALVATASAQAADLPSRVIAPVAPVIPVTEYDWTGAYIGIAAGGDFIANPYSTDRLATGFPVNQATNTADFNQSRFRLGGYLGYNYQIGQVVIGVEGDGAYDFGSRKSTIGIPGEDLVGAPNVDSVSANSRYDASARARLGVVLLPSLLFYATGGVAFRDASYSASCPGTGVNSFCSRAEFQTFSSTRTGYTVGGGIEGVVFKNLIARAEYRYSDFGTQNLSFFGAPNDVAGDFVGAHTHLTASTVTLGLAYKFDLVAPLPPVVARY